MADEDFDLSLLRQWAGKSEVIRDVIHAGTAAALAATLDRKFDAREGAALPPLWHWTYFWTACPQSQIGSDGHPQRGGFLPPVPLPRRMWAGGRLHFAAPLPIGAAATAAWARTSTPDPVLLFRYSARTFNGHRIHYDRSYVTQVEGYPGLIVHGPLIATLLLDLLHRNMPQAHVERFDFRAVGPLFDIEPFKVCGQPEDDGRTVRLWAQNARGELAMQAEATLRTADR